jgi:hypothetical protein
MPLPFKLITHSIADEIAAVNDNLVSGGTFVDSYHSMSHTEHVSGIAIRTTAKLRYALASKMRF